MAQMIAHPRKGRPTPAGIGDHAYNVAGAMALQLVLLRRVALADNGENWPELASAWRHNREAMTSAREIIRLVELEAAA